MTMDLDGDTVTSTVHDGLQRRSLLVTPDGRSLRIRDVAHHRAVWPEP